MAAARVIRRRSGSPRVCGGRQPWPWSGQLIVCAWGRLRTSLPCRSVVTRKAGIVKNLCSDPHTQRGHESIHKKDYVCVDVALHIDYFMEQRQPNG